LTGWLYNILYPLVFLALLPGYLLHMRRRGGYRRHFWQRIGRYESVLKRDLARGDWAWIHAVSVGECYVALRLMRTLRERDPSARFVLTVNTSTAHALAESEIGEPDRLLYFPLDWAPVMSRVMARIRPHTLWIVETEIWPNLIRLARRAGARVILVNGRMSERSYRGYRRVRFAIRPLMREFSALFMQSEEEAERVRRLGAPAERVRVVGTAKYDVAARQEPDGDRAREVLDRAGLGDRRPVLLGGSTWPGEEEILFEAYRELKARRPGALLVLAPRHAERRADVLDAARRAGCRIATRTGGERGGPDTDVYLLDTTGELLHFYAAADVVFVGKSLTRHGGQNPIEAARCRKAVVVGPHMENFRNVLRDLREGNGIVQAATAEAVKRELLRLADDDEARRALGAAAREVVRRGEGALERTVRIVERGETGGDEHDH
jgi:3-deoxy-D-manno-octulosonic-acid transferase